MAMLDCAACIYFLPYSTLCHSIRRVVFSSILRLFCFSLHPLLAYSYLYFVLHLKGFHLADLDHAFWSEVIRHAIPDPIYASVNEEPSEQVLSHALEEGADEST